MSEFLSKKLGSVQELLLGIPATEWLIAGVIGAVVWASLWVLRDLIAFAIPEVFQRQESHADPALAYLIGNNQADSVLAVASMLRDKAWRSPTGFSTPRPTRAMILILIQVGLWAGRAVRFYLEMKEVGARRRSRFCRLSGYRQLCVAAC